MKQLSILITMLVVLSSNLKAQLWCTPNSVWHFDTSNPTFYTTYTKHTYLYDTIISSTNFNKIKAETHGSGVGGPINNYGYFYTSLQGNVVFFNSTNTTISATDTLIYFGNIGSKWRVQPNGGTSCSQSFIQITDSGRATIQSEILKWRKVSYTNYYFYGTVNQMTQNGIDTIFERIGYKHLAFQFLGHCADATDHATSSFRCFQDNQINLNATNYPCTAITSINEFDSNLNNISLFPNPTSSILNINDEHNQFQKATIEIKNYLGQIVLSIPFSNQINISFLSNGIYFLTIKDGYNTKTIKIIKQ